MLAPMGLRLSEEKTTICHIDEGFDFLGFRIQRQPKRGTQKRYVYTYPSKKALLAVGDQVRTLTQGSHEPVAGRPAATGSTRCCGAGPTTSGTACSKATFSYLGAFAWRRVVSWLRRKHHRPNWKWLRRRYLPGWWPTEGKVDAVQPGRR